MARAACCIVDCRARQKPPSSLTRKRVHRRTGWTGLEQDGRRVLYEFNEWAAGAIPAPLPRKRVWTGINKLRQVGARVGRVPATDLRAFCAGRGCPPPPPIPPPAGHPSPSRNIPRLWRDGRVSRCEKAPPQATGIFRPHSLDPP